MDERLYRSRTDRMIGGVAAGVARSLRIDPTIVRVAWVVLAFATSGVAILVYFVLLFVMPEEPWAPEAGADGVPVATVDPGPSAAPTGTGGGGASDAASRPAWGSGVGPRSTSQTAARSTSDDGRTAALVFGVVLIALGAWFLLREWLPMLDLSVSWPYVAVGLGVVLVVISLFSGRRRS